MIVSPDALRLPTAVLDACSSLMDSTVYSSSRKD